MTGTNGDTERMRAAAERWNQEVKDTVPAERLLVWQPQDNEPLPSVNGTPMFKAGIMGAAVDSLQAWWEKERPPEP